MLVEVDDKLQVIVVPFLSVFLCPADVRKKVYPFSVVSTG